jgi:protein-arginine kinase
LQIVILPEKDTIASIREGFQRLIKLLQTFEKLGYATDPYLGNLTVSPRNLGTALHLEVDFHFDSKVDPTIDRDIDDEI